MEFVSAIMVSFWTKSPPPDLAKSEGAVASYRDSSNRREA
jgi:hypothetical protein